MAPSSERGKKDVIVTTTNVTYPWSSLGNNYNIVLFYNYIIKRLMGDSLRFRNQNIVSRRQINCCFDVAVGAGDCRTCKDRHFFKQLLRLRHVFVHIGQSGNDL